MNSCTDSPSTQNVNQSDEHSSIDINDTVNVDISDIVQIDGNVSIYSSETSETISLPDISNTDGNLSQPSGYDQTRLSDSIYSNEDTINLDHTIQSEEPEHIPVTISDRPLKKHSENERIAANLPNVSVINARSLWPKIESFATHFLETDTQVAIITEIWGKGSKREVYKIKELLEMKGIDLIFDLRKDKRGGGTAVATCSKQFTMTRINLPKEKGLEITAALIKNKNNDKMSKPIIIISVYSSPRSKFKNDLLNFLTLQISKLKTIYPKAAIIIGGDRNSISLDSLENLYPGLHQIVKAPTRKNKILDFICTDLYKLYQVPEILDPLEADDPNKAKPSDHSIPLARPRTNNNQTKGKRIITKRPMPESKLMEFGSWISTKNWDDIKQHEAIDDTVNKFTKTVQDQIDELFPTKTMKISINSKPWFDYRLKCLSNKKKLIFKKEGRSEAYRTAAKQFDNAKKEAIKNHINKTVNTVTKPNTSGLHKVLKKLGTAPGDVIKNTFSLPVHKGLSDTEIANDLGQFFSKISQEYKPINLELLPERVVSKLQFFTDKIPEIEPYQIYEKIKTMNIPDSMVPADFPPRIWKNFGVEMATPVSIIVNKILKTGQWPELFKREFVTVIEKEKNPETKSQLRNLSLTLFISKLVENIICDLLLREFGQKLDSGQFGGRPGYSVLLYLIKLVDFIMSNLDRKNAVIMALVDFSKAYNRQCHNRLLTCYSDLGTPPYLLRVLKSYLTKRKMIVRHNGAISDEYDIPGGGAQGTNLGILSYLVNINSGGVSLEEIIKCICGSHTGDICHPILPLPPPHITETEARFKYIDDLALLNSVPLTDLKKYRDNDMVRPLNYRDRTLHYLPNESSALQTKIMELDQFCQIQQFVINDEKTKTVIFNTARSTDFTPNMKNMQGQTYENVESFRLLGVDFCTDPKKGLNLETYLINCIQKGYNNLWILRRLAEMGVPIEHIFLAYTSRIRIFAEMNVPLWNFSLTKKMAKHIENLQKKSTYIILGSLAHSDYFCNLAILGLDTLKDRRDKIVKNFAVKTLKHLVHKNMFTYTQDNRTRSGPKIIVPLARTARYANSCIPSLGKLINEQLPHKINPTNSGVS